MRFEGMIVPGAEWVEIVSIREKDGSPLGEDNWRCMLFGQISLCWIAGGLRERNAFFRGKIRIKNGKIVDWNLDNMRWTSTTTAQPVEIEPGVFDFETNTCIYRFRILSSDEKELIRQELNELAKAKLEAMRMLMTPSAADDNIPAS